jgi:hypothetical protein
MRSRRLPVPEESRPGPRVTIRVLRVTCGVSDRAPALAAAFLEVVDDKNSSFHVRSARTSPCNAGRRNNTPDLAVFGAYPGVHVVVLLAGGSRDSDPLVVSRGGPDGPERFPLSEVIGFFGNDCPVTYLQLRPDE